jgi:CO/xanthine dehydrogenase FAD-binding subunit
MSAPHFFQPKSVAEATDFLAGHPRARMIAGGTDLIVKQRNGMLPGLTHLVDLNRLPLKYIEFSGGHCRIGSLCTMTQIVEHPELGRKFPTLTKAAVQVGALQIRNQATIGGNTANASPAGDTIPALLSLAADIVLTGPNGTRTLALENFFTGPGKTVMETGELIEAFLLPDRTTIGSFRKLGERRAHAISKVSLALAIVRPGPEGIPIVRIAMGAVAPTVIRCRRAETLLEGAKCFPEAALIQQAQDLVSDDARPIDDIRSTAAYRKQMAGVLFKRCLEDVKPEY